MASVGITLADREDGLLGELEDLAANIKADAPAHEEQVIGRKPHAYFRVCCRIS